MSSNNVTEEDKEKSSAFDGGFDEYGIALHFVLARPKGVSPVKPPDSDHHFRSFERDLLSHVYRDDPGFQCRVLELPVGYESLTLHLPKVLRYVAESERRELIQLKETLDQGVDFRTRSLLMRASLTRFRSGISILHIVFCHRPPEEPSVAEAQDKWRLSEYDFMKLSKLWEGGESVGMGEEFDIHDELRFSLSGDEAADRFTLHDIVVAVINHNNKGLDLGEWNHIDTSATDDFEHIRPRAGTIEIVVGEDEHRRGNYPEVFEVLVDLASKGPESPQKIDAAHEKVKNAQKDAKGKSILENQLVYVQGILCGLLDFNIDADEFNDVFDEPIKVNKTLLLDVQKGTLFKFITKDRAFESAYEKIGVNPYLLYPQALLLHNEELLAGAVGKANAADGAQSEELLREAELALREVLQRELLPNVFQYTCERKLFDDGQGSRGLTNLQNSLEQRLEEINGRLDEVVSRKGAFLNIGLALFGVVLAVGQLVSGWDALGKLVWKWGSRLATFCKGFANLEWFGELLSQWVPNEASAIDFVAYYFVPAFFVLGLVVVRVTFILIKRRRG